MTPLSWLDRHEGVRRVLRTFLYAFLGLAVPGVFGWLNDLTAWATSNGQAAFPDARNLGFLAVAAISAGSVALINGLGIWLENSMGRAILRGSGRGIVKRV